MEGKYNMQQEQINKLSQQSVSQQQEHPDAALDGTIPSSMPKSSVGSMEVPADDALLARYPVDDILESTVCELHVKLKNISMKVTDGFALPSGHEATFHGNPSTPGYARVGVDQVVSAYETLDLDYPGGEGEQTLGEIKTHSTNLSSIAIVYK